MITPLLLEEVRPLAERFAAAGFRIYLVGGIVRDQLLGRALSPSADIDLTTDAAPDSIKRVVGGLADAVWSQGERFGTIGCRIAARDYEITTHRGERYEPHSRKPSVVFSSELRHDLERRDFTVNAMAFEVPEGRLFDPFGGQVDLHAGVLRTPLAPEVSFSDDPLRMLRAARFVSGYRLRAVDDLVAAVDRLASRMAIVSVERRRDELDKLLAVDDPSSGFRFLRQHELLGFVLPTLAEADDRSFERALASVRALPISRGPRLAALLATDIDGGVDVDARVRALRHGNDVVAEVGTTAAGASAIWAHRGEWTDAHVRRLAASTRAQLDAAIALASTRIDVTTLQQAVRRLRAAEDLDVLRPALDGAAVMALLQIEPGVDVGKAMAFLRELRIEEGPLSTEQASRRLLGWWADQDPA